MGTSVLPRCLVLGRLFGGERGDVPSGPLAFVGSPPTPHRKATKPSYGRRNRDQERRPVAETRTGPSPSKPLMGGIPVSLVESGSGRRKDGGLGHGPAPVLMGPTSAFTRLCATCRVGGNFRLGPCLAPPSPGPDTQLGLRHWGELCTEMTATATLCNAGCDLNPRPHPVNWGYSHDVPRAKLRPEQPSPWPRHTQKQHV